MQLKIVRAYFINFSARLILAFSNLAFYPRDIIPSLLVVQSPVVLSAKVLNFQSIKIHIILFKRISHNYIGH